MRARSISMMAARRIMSFDGLNGKRCEILQEEV